MSCTLSNTLDVASRKPQIQKSPDRSGLFLVTNHILPMADGIVAAVAVVSLATVVSRPTIITRTTVIGV
jgi:hypothetical protein